MKPLRWTPVVILSLLLTLLANACRSVDDESVAVSVSLTQTAAAQAIGAASLPPAAKTPQVFFPGDLQPLDPVDCADLATAMRQTLEIQVAETQIAVQHEDDTGGGCQSMGLSNGLDFGNMLDIEEAMRSLLALRGWQEDPAAPACLGTGGWGPGASSACFNKGDALCEVFVRLEPVDDSLCSDDEPITVCFDQLSPEQLQYTTSLTCALDTDPAASPLESELFRIVFDVGAVQAFVEGDLPAGGIDHYVLSAMVGQEMTVNLLDMSGNPLPQETAALAIWGEDGTVLIPDHTSAASWTGELPLTQDYYLDVKSISSQPVSYILRVLIPPPPSSGDGQVFPQIAPFPFGLMQSIVLTGVPPILPPNFPVADGLPEVAGILITTDQGAYEISLDYGTDCRGAGACHYGSAAGMQTASDLPVGTRSFPFYLADAQGVDLARGLTGYFVPAACGASCDDARLWWVYQGYQYMLGLKGGTLEQVLELANAAIDNSLP